MSIRTGDIVRITSDVPNAAVEGRVDDIEGYFDGNRTHTYVYVVALTGNTVAYETGSHEYKIEVIGRVEPETIGSTTVDNEGMIWTRFSTKREYCWVNEYGQTRKWHQIWDNVKEH